MTIYQKQNMKKLLISSTLMLLLVVIGTGTSKAQVSVNVNIGVQPAWGPVGYDYVEYYYIPAYEIYYHVPRRQFVVFENGKWIFVTALPPRYKAVNLYNTYKVVINDPEPYRHFDQHKVKYVTYKNTTEKQVVIRDSKDPKYSEARKKQNGRQPEKRMTPEKQNEGGQNEKKDRKDDDKKPADNKPK